MMRTDYAAVRVEHVLRTTIGELHPIGSSYGDLAQAVKDFAELAFVILTPLEREVAREAAIADVGLLHMVQDPAAIVDIAMAEVRAFLAARGLV